MLKTLLIAVSFISFTLPAYSATKPTDVVNVIMFTSDPKDPAIVHDKTYSKPFNQLKLDAKTRQKIAKLNAELDQSKGGFEKFRLAWIRVDEENIAGFVFYGSRSTVWTVINGYPGSGVEYEYMYTTLDGNGILKCRSEKPRKD